ncbi:MAG: hypothetical protein KatS3mg002_1714 [Candidatus Woesearchaeota archaeon]|nr:MAG: hypothetical protein KatS3mg002_1714 [Candidatus Woesearchaeota archaeon]
MKGLRYILIIIFNLLITIRCIDTSTPPEEKFGRCLLLFVGMQALANAISDIADSSIPPQTPQEEQMIEERRKQRESANGIELCTILYLLESANEVSKK